VVLPRTTEIPWVPSDGCNLLSGFDASTFWAAWDSPSVLWLTRPVAVVGPPGDEDPEICLVD